MWRLLQVCSLPLRIPHLSFILPKAPCAFHCYQASFCRSDPFDPQSWSGDSSSLSGACLYSKVCRLTFAQESSRHMIPPPTLTSNKLYITQYNFCFLRLGTSFGASLNTNPSREIICYSQEAKIIKFLIVLRPNTMANMHTTEFFRGCKSTAQ